MSDEYLFVVAREGGRSSIPETLIMKSKSRGVLDRPVPSTPRLRRGMRSPWPAEALAKAASRTMTAPLWRSESNEAIRSSILKISFCIATKPQT
jgi:hypothetical protein